MAEAVDLYLRFALAGRVRPLRIEHGQTARTLRELSADCYAWVDERLAAQ